MFMDCSEIRISAIVKHVMSNILEIEVLFACLGELAKSFSALQDRKN